MSSLFGSMSIALRALLAQQGALQITSNNVANINTPGFSRQRPNMLETDPIWDGNLLLGTGVTLQGIVSLRDNVLELRLDEETQQQGQLSAFVNGMKQVEIGRASCRE